MFQAGFKEASTSSSLNAHPTPNEFLMQTGINTGLGKQAGVGASLDDPPILEY